MALIECKECGNKVSTRAKACPKCGAPVSLSEEPQQTPQNPPQTSPTPPQTPQEPQQTPQTPPSASPTPPPTPPEPLPDSDTPPQADGARGSIWFKVAVGILIAAIGVLIVLIVVRVASSPDRSARTEAAAAADETDETSKMLSDPETTPTPATDGNAEPAPESGETESASSIGETEWTTHRLRGTMTDANGPNPIELSFEQKGSELRNCVYKNVDLGGKIRMTGACTDDEWILTGKDGKYVFRIVVNRHTLEGYATDGPKTLTVSLSRVYGDY